jgi:hypothetical protein
MCNVKAVIPIEQLEAYHDHFKVRYLDGIPGKHFHHGTTKGEHYGNSTHLEQGISLIPNLFPEANIL